jgi:hypothetical protein
MTKGPMIDDRGTLLSSVWCSTVFSIVCGVH